MNTNQCAQGAAHESANSSRTLLGVLLSVVLLGWCAQTSAETAVVDADNIVVVLDASGSMQAEMPGSRDSKMQVAKSALYKVVTQLPPETNLGLLVFSGKNKSQDWIFPLGPVNPAALQGSLQPIKPKGGTPLGASIKRGADRLLEQREAQRGYGTYRLIIVTDGEASDTELVDRYTPQVLARGITVEVIGVAMMADHTLAQRVHAYRRADDTQSLTQALVSSIAEVGVSDDGTSIEEGFEMIAGLPNDLASAALSALRESGNEPIGETRVAVVHNNSAQAQSSGPTHSVPAPVGNGGGLSMGTIVFIVVIIMVFLQIVKSAAKRSSRG
ncbi:MAG: vWA domain-containing protein [Planctomycetota bacterium]